MGLTWPAGCCLLLLIAGSAAAQDVRPAPRWPDPPQPLSAAERRSAVNGALSRLADPTMTAAASGPVPTLLLEAGTAAKIASGRIGIQIGDLVVDLKLRGVIDSATKQAVLADLDGLRHTSTAEFGVLWTNYPSQVPLAAIEDARREYAATAAASAPAAAAAASAHAAGAAPGRPSAAAAGPGAARAAAIARLLKPRRLFVAGASYRAGPETFRYVLAPAAESIGAHRVNWAVNALAGLVVSDRLSFGAMYSHVVTFRSGDIRQFCLPAADGIFECVERVVGAPVRVRTGLVTLDARTFVSPALAIAPRILVNPATGAFGVDLPVYFLRTAKGGLAGGIVAAWRHSRTGGATLEVSAFVGQVLTLLLR